MRRTWFLAWALPSEKRSSSGRRKHPGEPDRISLRVAEREDLEFLFSLLKASLGPYVEQTFGPWKDEEQRARFFESTDPATHQVIELGGQPIGCLDVRWLPDQVKLNRIFLLPAHQNRGIGTRLVREVVRRRAPPACPSGCACSA